MGNDPIALVERARAYKPYNHLVDGELVTSLLALIAQQAATIEAVTKERDENRANWLKAEAEAYELKYAAAGGEDAPGAAHAVTVADVDRWRREDEARATAAEAERDRLREDRDSWRRVAERLEAEKQAARAALSTAKERGDG